MQALVSVQTNGKAFFAALRGDCAGATSIEYGLLASLIAVASMQAIDTIGGTLSDTYNTASNGLAGKSADEPPPAAADEPPTAAARVG